MTTQEIINSKIEEENTRRNRIEKVIAWLTKHAEGLDELEVEPIIYGEQVDFDHLPHEKIMKLMEFLKAGTWKKEYRETVIDYSTTIDGIVIRCWAGEPPPSCKLVKEEVTVPSHYVPEHTEIKFKLVCTEG